MKLGLLVNEEEVAAVREKTRNHSWAECAFRNLKLNADEIFAGDRLSNRSLAAIEAAAFVFALTGNGEYAERAASLILRCNTFPELFGTSASATYDFGCNTLYTGRQLPHLCIALDLLWETISENDRDRIINTLILPAAKHLRTNDRRDSNWQTLHSSALLSAGLLIEDRDMSDFALNHPDHGLTRHMTTSFLRDGLHWEGSFGYHTFTRRHLMLGAEMARRTGVDLYKEGEGAPYIKRMLDVSIHMAFPDGSLPVNNDAHTMNLFDQAQDYELAYARYRDPAYGWIIEKSDRTSLYALLYGETDMQSAPPESRSRSLEQTGWTALKNVEGCEYWNSGATVAILDHGPHGDWHGHPDKLGIELFANGLRWIQNAGSPVGYHCQQHWDYYRKTLAHNTVVVDFQDQYFERSRDNVFNDLERTGEVLVLDLDKKPQTVSASVDWVYPGIQYKRTLSLGGNILTDEFEIAAGEEHTYDYILHGRGTVEPIDVDMAKARIPQDEGGYEYLIHTRSATVDGDVRLAFLDGGWPDGRFVPTGKKLELLISGEPGAQIFIGYAPSHLSGVNTPFVLVRRKTRHTTFRTVFTPSGK